MKFKYYSNEELKRDCDIISNQYIRDNGKPDLIVGIVRGGLIPAVYISHKTKTPMTTVSVSLRDHVNVDWSSFETVNKFVLHNRKILFVDDLTDSGKTLSMISKKYGKSIKTSVLIHNTSQNICVPDYYGSIIDKEKDDRWIIFPWEEQ